MKILLAAIIILIATTTYARSGRDITSECRVRCTYKVPNRTVSYALDQACYNECYTQVNEEIRQAELDTAIIDNLDAETALLEQMRRELRLGNKVYYR